MKSKLLVLFVITATFLACNKESVLIVNNSLDIDRPNEVIVLTRDYIGQITPIKEGFLPVFEINEQIAPSQTDDLNRDGIWDEVAVLINFSANESKKLKLAWVPKNEYPEFEKRTNLRLGIIREDGKYKEVDNYKALPCANEFKIIAQAESVNWENDKIAFRNYFDCRNVKDLFGKLQPKLILDNIGLPEMGNYHELNEWGMDILHCGSSLGSGGIALLRNDSLFRLGSTREYEYYKLTEGPVRSVFELRYKGWKVEEDTLEAVERISIYPGKYWFESDVTVNGLNEGDQVVTGIVTSMLKNEPFQFQTDSFQCIGTHDVQSLNNDELGMALIVPLSETGKIGRTSNTNFFNLGFQTVVEKGFSNIISETFYIGQKCKNDVPVKHYFFAVWGLEQEQWKTENGFKDYISEEAKRLSSPISIK